MFEQVHKLSEPYTTRRGPFARTVQKVGTVGSDQSDSEGGECIYQRGSDVANVKDVCHVSNDGLSDYTQSLSHSGAETQSEWPYDPFPMPFVGTVSSRLL